MGTTPTPWPQAATELAVKLWLEGRSATEIRCRIARDLKVIKSRNAVIGKLHRLGYTDKARSAGASPGTVERIAKKRRAAKKAAIAFVPNKVITPTKREVLRAELALIACLPPLTPGATLTSTGGCRYINGDPQIDATVCGRATADGAWCVQHRKLVYQKAEPRARVRTVAHSEHRRALADEQRRMRWEAGAAL